MVKRVLTDVFPGQEIASQLLKTLLPEISSSSTLYAVLELLFPDVEESMRLVYLGFYTIVYGKRVALLIIAAYTALVAVFSVISFLICSCCLRGCYRVALYRSRPTTRLKHTVGRRPNMPKVD